MTIKFLYHKGKDSFIGRAIVGWTWLLGCFYNWKVLKYNFSHEEVWTPSIDGTFSEGCIFYGDCFSSTTRGDAKGVRIAPASEVLKHPERWDYIEVEVDAERLEVAIQEAQKLVGCKYDYWGIFGFVQPFNTQVDDDWFCSEVCDWFKKLCGIVVKREKRISPRRSAYKLAQMWHEPKSLV